MKLVIAGCGTAAPDADRAASGYYLEVSGLKLLLDCGPGVVHHLARFDLDWQHLTHLCVTHYHNDHIGDIPTLFFAWKWGMLPARKAPLQVLGPKGMQRKLKQMGTAMGDHVVNTQFEVDVKELHGEDELLLGDVVHVKTLRTPHTKESIAFRIDSPEGSVGYTGDTGYSEQLSTFLSRVDMLIMECSLPDDLAMDTHLTPSSAARMAQQANPGVLVLTHVFPQLDRNTLIDQISSRGWTGDTVVAADGLIIE